MINKFLKGVLFGLLFLGIAFVAWQGNLSFNLGKQKTITVTGSGKVKMKPEVARFTAGVQRYGQTVKEAMDQEEIMTKAIISALKDAGVKEEDIKTSSFSVWPQTTDIYEGNVRKPQITGYQVSNSIEVKVRDVNRVSDLLGLVVANGANNVYGVTFGADDPKEQEADAREKAILDAREKAEKMAEAAGRRLGKIISINEGTAVSTPYTIYKGEAGGVGGGGPAVEAGGLEISQAVTVVFELK